MSIRFPGLGLNLPYIGRTVRILGWEVSYYGILIAMGLVLALFFIILEAKRSRMDVNHPLNAMIASIVLGTVFARGFYVAVYWNLYKTAPLQIFNLRAGGLALYGALFGSICAIGLVCVTQKESFGKMADLFSIGALIAQMIGRWGDFFNRCSFGEYTQWPTAMQLPLAMVSSGEVTPLMRENLLTLDGTSFIQCHPAFAYESLWCLILLFYVVLRRRKKLFHGEIFLRYLAGYGLGRFFIEFLRTDKMMLPGTVIPVNMVISAALFVICTPILLIRRMMTRKRNDYHKRRRERTYEIEEEVARAQEERDLLKSLNGDAVNNYEEGYYASQAIPMEYGKARTEQELEAVLMEARELHVEEAPESEEEKSGSGKWETWDEEDDLQNPASAESVFPEESGAKDREWDEIPEDPESEAPGSDKLDSDAFGSDELESDAFGSDELDSDEFGSDELNSDVSDSDAPDGDEPGSDEPDLGDSDSWKGKSDPFKPAQETPGSFGAENLDTDFLPDPDRPEEEDPEGPDAGSAAGHTPYGREESDEKDSLYAADPALDTEPTTRTFTFGDLLKQQKFPDPPEAETLPWDESN